MGFKEFRAKKDCKKKGSNLLKPLWGFLNEVRSFFENKHQL
ncbi:MAG: hypothetical protein JWO44_206 [Bacteroidetes bacterium]|nr:hypothetical protein [Bacteroidota bacterium]